MLLPKLGPRRGASSQFDGGKLGTPDHQPHPTPLGLIPPAPVADLDAAVAGMLENVAAAKAASRGVTGNTGVIRSS